MIVQGSQISTFHCWPLGHLQLSHIIGTQLPPLLDSQHSGGAPLLKHIKLGFVGGHVGVQVPEHNTFPEEQ